MCSTKKPNSYEQELVTWRQRTGSQPFMCFVLSKQEQNHKTTCEISDTMLNYKMPPDINSMG